MDFDKLAVRAFNEWMRRYIEEPERFMAEFQAVELFRRDEAEGREPTYGDAAWGYVCELMGELVLEGESTITPTGFLNDTSLIPTV